MLGHRDGCHRKPLITFNAGPIALIFQCEALRERGQAPSVRACERAVVEVDPGARCARSIRDRQWGAPDDGTLPYGKLAATINSLF